MDGATEIPESMPMDEPDSRNSENIDLSLDEIIKRNKKEKRANSKAAKSKDRRLTNKNNVLKKLNKAQQSNFVSRRGAFPSQGSNRSRRGFGVTRGTFFGKGISPLNRPSLNTKFGQLKTTSRGRPFRGRGRGLGRGGNVPQLQTSGPGRGGKPFVLNRAFSSMSTRSRGSLQKTRGWKNTPSTGSMLTVSLSNSNAGTEARFGQTASTSFTQPKGIPLRFNFKAVSNQTTVTMNDRFSSLTNIRGRGQRIGDLHGRGRGRGRGGVGIRGREAEAAGRGRGASRGRGRGGARGRGGLLRGRGGGARGRGGVRGAARGGAVSRETGAFRGRGRGGRRGRGGGRGRGVGEDRTVMLQ